MLRRAPLSIRDRIIASPAATKHARIEQLQRLGALALAIGACVAIGQRCACAPDVAFLFARGDGAWITDPDPVDAKLRQYKQAKVPVATFTTRFSLSAAPAEAVLQVEAARVHRVRVNGAELWASPDPDPRWRSGREGDVAPQLRAGDNEIAIDVWNPRGPPLLRARLELGGKSVVPTDTSWSVSRDGAVASAAVLADDTRPHPSAAASPRPARAFRAQALLLLGIFIAAYAVMFVGAPWLARHRARLPLLALVLVHIGWIALFAGKFASLPLTTGFDATNHLVYVDVLRRDHRMPLANEGWSTYHPPLYYAAAALLQEGFAGFGPGAERVATKLPSFLAGLGTLWVAFALARMLLPARPELVAVAVLFAGVLPLDVYTSAYVSNEPLHAALFGVATLACVRALLRRRLRLRDAALVGLGVGFALLAKVTALLLASVAGFFLLVRGASVEGVRPARLAAIAAAYAAPIAVVSGWFYARNVQLYGTPIAGNWNLPGMIWWSQPGFHTPAYYLGFGESLVRPAFSGFHSFADALYASFWGDGWIAGRANAAFPTEIWNWDFAAVGYWLALPATLVLGWGVARMLRLAFTREEGARRAAWSFLLALEAAVAFALVALTLDLPYFGQAKASYALGVVGPLAVAFALGADACDRALAVLGGVGAARVGRAFWITTGAVLWLSMAA
jgi:Dolichyl-phosphate-mannose-protein mannosyltransferase